MTQRFKRHPCLALFDGPDTNVSTAKRRTSTVPLQALYLMNNEFVRARAGEFADRLLKEAENDSRRLSLAHLATFGRLPNEMERHKATEYLDRFIKAPANKEKTERKRKEEAWTSYARILFCANEFVYID